MKTVTFTEPGQNVDSRKIVGTISWDGQKVVANPPNDPILMAVLREPVYGISAKEDGEQFVNHLTSTYCDVYLYAYVVPPA